MTEADELRVKLKDGSVEHVKEEVLDQFLEENKELTQPQEFPGVATPAEIEEKRLREKEVAPGVFDMRGSEEEGLI